MQYAYCWFIAFTLFSIPLIMSWEHPVLTAYMLQVLIMPILAFIIRRKALLQCIGASGIAFIMVYIVIRTFFITGSSTTFNALLSLETMELQTLVISLISDVFLLVVLFFLRQRKLSVWFERLYSVRKGSIITTVFVATFILVWVKMMQYLSVQFLAGTEDFDQLYLLSFVTIIGSVMVLLLVLTVYYRNAMKNERLQRQEFMLQQQQAYISNLEQLQHEIRAFQHDYKNIMASLYASRSDDKVNETLNVVSRHILSLEQNLDQSIQESTHLSRVRIDEVKGLLLAKLSKAKGLQVSFTLEAVKDVTEVYMDRVDFIRCLGILLDNAIEAAAGCEGGFVKAALIQDQGRFVLIVRNSYADAPSVSEIWNNGYSTKGDNRGIGLYSYKTLVNRYGNVVTETVLEDGSFVQVIKSFKEKSVR
ncbi:GHKL domain-containing protein [Paenibacillus sp. FSL R7-0273]|uniref:sensor histidine kinase n=1 Tax=Paenibacillus sp. FSL R7-0273 TaxID=1536772 RepID=UPI0015C3B686|nr:GHKL domain-containing protein [Paenibacillus sp. FSL R7-0273]